MDELPEEILGAIYDSIYEGKKLHAIKIYRDHTKSSLVDSRDAIFAMERQLQDEAPERFAVPRREANGKEIDAVLDAIFKGNKLLAVKLYRNASGASLIAAKEFVEDLTAKLREEQADQFTRDEKKGCTVVTTTGAVIFLVANYLLWQLVA